MVRKGALNSVGGQEEVCGAAVERARVCAAVDCFVALSGGFGSGLTGSVSCGGPSGPPGRCLVREGGCLENQSAGAPSAECAGGDICF